MKVKGAGIRALLVVVFLPLGAIGQPSLAQGNNVTVEAGGTVGAGGTVEAGAAAGAEAVVVETAVAETAVVETVAEPATELRQAAAGETLANAAAVAEGASATAATTADTAADPTPSPELKKAENIDLDQVVVEPAATPLPRALDETPEPTSHPEPAADTAAPVAAQVAPAAEPATQTPLVMLDSEVPPGTSTRLSWTPQVSFMGIAAPTPVLVVHGAKPGPKVCLTAAIHGDELNGIEVVRHLLYSIDPQELAGTVIGVPIVNLQGFRRSSRYLPDRRDLNRYFPGNAGGSSASRIAYSFFAGVIQHCDLLVDFHTGSFHRTNLPQLRADLSLPQVADLSRKMGSIVVVHSEGAQGCLRRAAVEAGIPAVTLEAGEPLQLQKSAVNHGIKSVENLFDALGMLDRRPFWRFKSEPVYYQSRWVRATSGGILFSEVELGDSVHSGDVLGAITDPITNVREEVVAPFDGRVIGMALNQVMYPGFAAYHIGLQSSVEAVSEEAEEQKNPDLNEDGTPDPVGETPEVDELDERLLEDSE